VDFKDQRRDTINRGHKNILGWKSCHHTNRFLWICDKQKYYGKTKACTEI